MAAFLNKRCPKCNWHTLSHIGRDYKFCPMCGGELEGYDMLTAAG